LSVGPAVRKENPDERLSQQAYDQVFAPSTEASSASSPTRSGKLWWTANVSPLHDPQSLALRQGAWTVRSAVTDCMMSSAILQKYRSEILNLAMRPGQGTCACSVPWPRVMGREGSDSTCS